MSRTQTETVASTTASTSNASSSSSSSQQRPLGDLTSGSTASERLGITPRPNTAIASVPIAESRAFPTEDAHVRYAEQPEDWPLEVRGMPRYRPLNRDLDHALRPLGANGGQRFFLTFMLSGVLVQEMANRVWRSTIGRFPAAESWFVFKIGGQW